MAKTVIGFAILGGIAYSIKKYFENLALNAVDTNPEKKRERIVILGTGWAALSFLRTLRSDEYEVVVVSPRNYFLFTPLLASVTVGTLNADTVREPIRKHLGKPTRSYYQAECISVDPEANTITCKEVIKSGQGELDVFKLEYDYLIVAVGGINNTFGTPGVYQYCHFLREIEDATKIRTTILERFEAANIPSKTEEQRKNLLSFVVIGGGPNGVEVAAEISDFFREDLKHWFPNLVSDFSLTLVELQDHILNTYDRKISDYAEQVFSRDNIQVKTKHQVVEVKDSEVIVKTKTKTGIEITTGIPYGLCVWATGVGSNPLTQKITKSFPDTQNNQRALVTDGYMAVVGSKNIYALGGK